MGMQEYNEKILIENEFGPLWSGVDTLLVGDKVFTAKELKRAFDLWAADIVGIDLHILTDGQYAFRFYDGDDRCVVVFVFDEKMNITRELRAHIAEWLQEEYYGIGMEAFFAGKMVKLLRRKVRGEEDSPPG
ncbi:MAG: hypothetical protein AABY80_00510 [Candidatus Deferrimicrobiota bacterium]